MAPHSAIRRRAPAIKGGASTPASELGCGRSAVRCGGASDASRDRAAAPSRTLAASLAASTASLPMPTAAGRPENSTLPPSTQCGRPLSSQPAIGMRRPAVSPVQMTQAKGWI